MNDRPSRIVVIGTAGHVDHGKSTLVQALTGTDPDRLAEEKKRGLTIDLGFAWRELPSGTIASFVDVPGHEDFIRNALAGAGGIDAALLVIAADEGPMPQTREHLAILDLLHVEHGVIALTKTDMVDDEWLPLVTDDITALVEGTTFETAPIVPVSAKTGDGLDAILEVLDTLLAGVPTARDAGRARLSVDRVFSMAGFGTVVTGTLRDGTLAVGDVLEILPSGSETRARGVQMHGRAVERALPGTRAAVNLVGVDTDDLERGDVIATPGAYRATRLVDASIDLLSDTSAPLRHDAEVALFHGASEIIARVRLIGERRIEPGGSGYVQLHLAKPTVLAAGDRLVIRLPSPSTTIGGGIVLDPHPPHRHRRFREEVVDRFRVLGSDSPEARVFQTLAESEPCLAAVLENAPLGLESEEVGTVLDALEADGRAMRLGTSTSARIGARIGTRMSTDMWSTAEGWAGLAGRLRGHLSDYHRANPLRHGPPPEELRGRLGLDPAAFTAVLAQAESESWLARDGAAGIPRLFEHEVRFTDEQAKAVAALMARFSAAPHTPPSKAESIEAVGADVVDALIARGDLVAVEMDVLFERETYEKMRAAVVERLRGGGRITVADVRDLFGTSRKYALGLMEHLDRIHVTRRMGDLRVLARASEDGA